MLVSHFIFDLLWSGWSSSVNSVAFLGFRELKEIEGHAARRKETNSMEQNPS